jgi:hypothetical protein
MRMKTYNEANLTIKMIFIEFVIKIFEDCSAAVLTPTATTTIEYMVNQNGFT